MLRAGRNATPKSRSADATCLCAPRQLHDTARPQGPEARVPSVRQRTHRPTPVSCGEGQGVDQHRASDARSTHRVPSRIVGPARIRASRRLRTARSRRRRAQRRTAHRVSLAETLTLALAWCGPGSVDEVAPGGSWLSLTRSVHCLPWAKALASISTSIGPLKEGSPTSEVGADTVGLCMTAQASVRAI